MITSEEIDKISEALALAQGEFLPVVKNKQNPHFKNWYADLSSILDATRPALSKYGIAFSQFPEFKDGRVIVITRLNHKSGQWFQSDLSLKPQADAPQPVGSAITYSKRYQASAILGIDSEDDDDNQAATDGAKPETTAAQAALLAAEAAKQKALEKKKFNEEFTKKMTEMMIDKSQWEQIYNRLVKGNYRVDSVQTVIDEMEREREKNE